MENPSAKEIWDKASQLIKSEINGISYDSWFKDIVPVSFDGQVLTLLVNIEFIRNMLRNNYDQLIQAALMQAAGEPVRYVVRIPSEMNAPREEAPARPSAAASVLNPKYTFSTYVIGKSNNFAHAAAYAVSQSPGDTYNPLFLYSGVGLGKTHLMHAIGHAILEKNPQSRILYITSETFTNDLINAISSNIVDMKEQISVLEVEQVSLLTRYEQAFDLATVKEAAQSAGMRQPDDSQIFYIDLPGEDQAVSYGSEDTSVLSRFFAAVGRNIYAAVEYFR